MENYTEVLIRVTDEKPLFIAKNNAECIEFYKDEILSDEMCGPMFDDYICWPRITWGSNSTHPCPRISSVGGHILGFTSIPEAFVTRICNENGTQKSDYRRCVDYLDELYEEDVLQKVVAYIVFVGCILSLITLALSLFIFWYFKNLQCSRTVVHRNLCAALFLHLLLLLITATQSIFDYSDYNINWLCKASLSLQMYSSMASINWMFLEGLLLHNKVAVNIFHQDTPFKLYYFIGWGLPALLIVIWCCLMQIYHEARCWKYFGQSKFIYVVVIPITVALLINLLFLANIIRVLVSRRPVASSVERGQIKKAVKAAALLLPLLGITHLLFCFSVDEIMELKVFFIIANAFIQSSQGLFVGILYCFMNTDVQKTLKNAYSRSLSGRDSNRRFMGRFLSQTSQSYLSHSENISRASSKHKINSVTLKSEDYSQMIKMSPQSQPQSQFIVESKNNDGRRKSLDTML